MTYALDTNTIIYYLRGDPNVRHRFRDLQIQGNDFIIPKMVDYEIRRGFRIKSAPSKRAAYEILTEELNIPELDTAVWEKAEDIYAELYKKHYTVGEMDILIAASCLVNDYILVTTNIKDFENIDGLDIVDWSA